MEMISDDKNMKLTVIVVTLLALTDCANRTEEPVSPIVDKARAAGAGDLASASAPSIEEWLRKHRDLAVDLDSMCGPARRGGDAKWLDSTEGRLCTAARNAAMYAPKKPLRHGDGQTFEPGWK
jgi:hypothetical protein